MKVVLFTFENGRNKEKNNNNSILAREQEEKCSFAVLYEHKLVNPLWKKNFIISNIQTTNAYILFPTKFPPKNMFFRYSQKRTK